MQVSMLNSWAKGPLKMRSFEFTLTEPIKVSVNGDFIEADTIVCHSPSAARRNIIYRFRQKFMNALLEVTKKANQDSTGGEDNKDSDEELPASEIEQMIFASNIDIEAFINDFMQIITFPGTAKIRDQDLIKSHIEKMTPDDFPRLMGEYIAYFFAPSWLNQKTKE